MSITADKSSNVFWLSHTLVENSKEQWKQTEEACTHPARARGADKYAATSLTPGVPGKISALCLSLPLSSLPPSFFLSLTCVFPTDTPLSSPPSHLHAYHPSFYPSKTKENKKQRRRCAYEYVVGLGLVVRNGKRTCEFWMDGKTVWSLRLVSAFDREKTVDISKHLWLTNISLII